MAKIAQTVTAGILAHESWLRYGFSTRDVDGDLARPAGPGAAQRRLAQTRFVTRVAGRGRRPRLLTLRQIHSAVVWDDPRPDTPGDALMTARRGVFVGVRAADCVPVLLADPRRRVVAAAHAGWKGTLARIAEKTVGEMRRRHDSDPADIRAVIGPSIRRCCYEVSEEIRQRFGSQFGYADDLFSDAEEDPVRLRYPALFLTGAPPGHAYDPRWNRDFGVRLDLAEANRRQLLQAGVKAECIQVTPCCTYCEPKFFYSHRRLLADGSPEGGRMLAVIGIV